MAILAPFVERRSHSRLRETPLRRRSRVRFAAPERRRLNAGGFAVAETLESNLDRYPTKPAMLTFLRSLIYAAEDDASGAWRPAYLGALRQAANVVHEAPTPLEAIATLHGYQAFIARRHGAAH